MPYNRYLAAVLQFVSDVTDPYLNLFRRFMPAVCMGPGALDLSPIVATIVLIFLSSIVARLIRG
jgi:YggT family protein